MGDEDKKDESVKIDLSAKPKGRESPRALSPEPSQLGVSSSGICSSQASNTMMVDDSIPEASKPGMLEEIPEVSEPKEASKPVEDPVKTVEPAKAEEPLPEASEESKVS